MDLTPQLALDWRGWDDTEPVVFESVRPTGPPAADGGTADRSQKVSVPFAKRLDMTARELIPAGGGYQAGEVIWLIPDTFLPNGAEPGDVIAAAGGPWNVLDTRLSREDYVWEIHARNPVVAFNLRDTVDIERPTISYDTAGAAVMLFPSGPPPNGGTKVYPALACKVHSLEDAIADERGIRGTQKKYQVFLSRQVNVTQYDRVNWEGTILDIVAAHNQYLIDELPWLECVRKV
jgi:hypothetical protein